MNSAQAITHSMYEIIKSEKSQMDTVMSKSKLMHFLMKIEKLKLGQLNIVDFQKTDRLK